MNYCLCHSKVFVSILLFKSLVYFPLDTKLFISWAVRSVDEIKPYSSHVFRFKKGIEIWQKSPFYHKHLLVHYEWRNIGIVFSKVFLQFLLKSFPEMVKGKKWMDKAPVASLEWVPLVPRNPQIFRNCHSILRNHIDLEKIRFYQSCRTHRFEILTTPLSSL